jgi:predicted HAD superfamily Cof-like phosphohydrolase
MTCTCGSIETTGIAHRADGPCYHRESTPNLLDGTTEFMERAGQLDADPNYGDAKLRELRRHLLEEEYREYRQAETYSNLVETVDGLLDVIVIAWGTLLSYVGEDKAKAAAAEVVRSNLDKVRGDIRRRPDGKILKPEGWTPPDIAGAIA